MKYTIKDFKRDFPNDDVCLDYIFGQRYGKDSVCPKCGKTGFYRVSDRKCYACAWCGHQIHPLANTIFHKSSTKLTDWFFAIFLMSQSKNGVSAKEIERHLGVTYKTAWRIQKQIRSLMTQDNPMLGGTVEVDETYVGGKRRGTRGRGAEGKTPVIGMAERKGGIKAQAVRNMKSSIVIPIMRRNVQVGTHIMTDDFSTYSRVKEHGFKHGVINHSAKEYVRGDIHTNTIEGFWSQMKRSIDGTYHSVSPKYLQTYVDEFAYRYNHRASSVPVFHLLLERLVV
ncbi:MAG: hypothetical protein A2060_03645 [Planctomycetes bacterium GWA2_50_13]|nr:MAG: hypothetical protein A2060_03645 [Planctomycetes bacterium GWA2_50_13]OHB92075.1 MAG: hypothetical protein A3E75_00290 [Planctomycetes bacterium RIFCSPHIGHO2_12_FULL_51_37]OHB96340.1 MAG: hypothetical protein A3I59_09150 [Planctomycetes bacterium RIFCSPLOWO2_02_FULL_50_16]OHC02389.1 MAG: hypothetical protein A3G17_04460 [Planctomycetes bacterium RIFCSPLOWO2_12_FULL_50_35]